MKLKEYKTILENNKMHVSSRFALYIKGWYQNEYLFLSGIDNLCTIGDTKFTIDVYDREDENGNSMFSNFYEKQGDDIEFSLVVLEVDGETEVREISGKATIIFLDCLNYSYEKEELSMFRVHLHLNEVSVDLNP